MKSRTLTCISAMTLFAVIAVQVTAQDNEEPKNHLKHRHYKLIDLGTFGGPVSYINPVGNGGPYMSRRGEVVGSSQTSIPIPENQNGFPCPSPPDEVFHAMEWSHGRVADLESLGDASNCANVLAINDRGEGVGTSENGRLDPITGALQIRAVVWKNGLIRNLGTFGGNHSFASSINNRDQIVGFALNKIPDPYSLFEFGIGGLTTGTQTRAFLWEDEHMQDLKTLGGPDAWATFVNERDQVAGISYTNSTPNPATGIPTLHPFLWKNGKMNDLGSFGGFGTVLGPNDPVGVSGLNNRGQVIGVSAVTGDQFSDPFLWDGEKLIDIFTSGMGGNFLAANAINDAGDVVGVAAFPNRPFDAALWRNGVVTDLGALDIDCFSVASVLNSRGQILGTSISCDGSTSRAFLWEDGTITDLSTLIPPNSGFQMQETNAINDRGDIAGNGLPPGCTSFNACSHAFLLISFCEDGSEGCADAPLDPALVSRSRAVSGAAPRKMTAEELKTFKERVTRMGGRNRSFGVSPRE